ncbi:hypothetical protein [Mycolicibacter senuensis]|uniref:ARB-07466-like C-terminal domain-containing protein n=2 Tax=Mycolicibacter senuensis TaxID=386913 RepID=A0A7I9XKC7_9MYCO|nr:hypothetical protein [Mycolicibacter senuensis]GFG70198.1 hypothetical protein MSEN_19180 [Mycolicibacter senuensis]
MLTQGLIDLRMKSTVLAATAVLPAAVFLAGGVGAEPPNNDEALPAGAADAPPPPPEDLPPPPPEDLPPPPPEDGAPPPPDDAPPPPAEMGPPPPFEGAPPPPPQDWGPPAPDLVTNWSMPAPQALPPGIANERGMQVKTILVSRSISEAFPQVHNMIGVRPDGQRWHPSGLAIDIMIPNAGSAEGIALGDEIVAYALRNAGRFALQDAIWRGTYYTPAGPSGGGNGHYDHVHITTFGGGYPNGGEEYLREEGEPAPA